MVYVEKEIVLFNGRPLWSSLLLEDPVMEFAVKDLSGDFHNVRQIFSPFSFLTFLALNPSDTYKIIGCGGVIFEEPIEISRKNLKPESRNEVVKIEVEEIPAPILSMIEADEYVRAWNDAPPEVNRSAFEYCFEDLVLLGPGEKWTEKIYDAVMSGLVYSEVLEQAGCPEWFAQILFHKNANFWRFYKYITITPEKREECYELCDSGLNAKKVSQKLKMSREAVKHFLEARAAGEAALEDLKNGRAKVIKNDAEGYTIIM